MEQSLRVTLSTDSSKFIRGLNQASNRLNSFGNRLKGVGSSLQTRLTLPLSLAGGMAVKSASDFERLRTSLDVLSGSAEKGAESFQRLVQFSAQTPFQLTELAKVNNMLLGFGMNTEEAFEALKMLGDVASVSGGDLNGVARAFGQASATGKLFAEDINQLIDNSVPVIKLLAEEMGVAEGQIKQLASEGKVGFEDLRNALRRATSAGGMFENGMQKLSGTFAGQLSTFRDNLNIAFAEFGKIILPILSGLLKNLTGLAQRFGALDADTKKIVITLAGLTAVLPTVITLIGNFGVLIGALVSPIGLVLVAVASLVVFQNELYNAFVVVNNFIRGQMLKAFEHLSAGFRKFQKRLQFVSNAIKGFFKEGSDFDSTKLREDLDTELDKIDEALETKLKEIDEGVAQKISLEKTEKSFKDVIQKATDYIKNLGLISFNQVEATLSAGGVKATQKTLDSLGGATVGEGFKGLEGVSGQGLFNQVTQSIDRFSQVTENRMDKIKQKLSVVNQVAMQFGRSMVSVFETMLDGGPFIQEFIKMLGKLLKKLIATAMASALLSLALNAIFPGLGAGGAFSFANIFKGLSGIGGGGFGGAGRSLGVQSPFPKGITPGRSFGRLNASRSLGQTIDVRGDVRVQGQDLILALQRAETTRSRIIG